jgi:hypothetical protein
MKEISDINLEDEILKAVCYFDIFDYPLKLSEISKNIAIPNVSNTKIQERVNILINSEVLESENEFIFLIGKNHSIQTRLDGESRAKSYLGKAKFMSGLIASFPFVKCVFISGSLSKMTMDDGGDIDYFIITDKKRMWLAKTLLIIFKKIFLLNSKKYFCVNFFLSNDNLQIKNENHFTATEVTYLIPAYNPELASEFLSKNRWTKQFYPNFNRDPINIQTKEHSKLFKQSMELILNNRLGNWLDEFFHDLHIKHKKRKFNNLAKEQFNHQFKSEKNISNHFPVDYQKIVLERLEDKMLQIQNQGNRSIV